MGDPIKIMFVCTGNSARSQMAEGFARQLGQGRIEAHSAGMEPSRLNPFAVAAMREKGIDISPQRSKTFDEDLARRMDVVVTVCGNADERCPVLPPEVKKLHWPLEDPAAAKGTDAEILATFRKSRDEIETQVLELTRRLESIEPE
jgi:arsenate reductase